MGPTIMGYIGFGLQGLGSIKLRVHEVYGLYVQEFVFTTCRVKGGGFVR